MEAGLGLHSTDRAEKLLSDWYGGAEFPAMDLVAVVVVESREVYFFQAIDGLDLLEYFCQAIVPL